MAINVPKKKKSLTKQLVTLIIIFFIKNRKE